MSFLLFKVLYYLKVIKEKKGNIFKSLYITLLTISSIYIKRFCLEFFGLKNQTRGHVIHT